MARQQVKVFGIKKIIWRAGRSALGDPFKITTKAGFGRVVVVATTPRKKNYKEKFYPNYVYLSWVIIY